MSRKCAHRWSTTKDVQGRTHARCIRCKLRAVWTFTPRHAKPSDAGSAVASMVTGAVSELGG